MRIAISGASGFVGTYLTKTCKDRGYEIVPLNRFYFESGSEDLLRKAISGCEVVINLAGASINRIWTKSYKKEIYESRIPITRKIVSAINSLEVKPQLLISASAVGYYPSQGCFDEFNSRPGNKFLSKICIEWEQEAQKVNPEVRLAITRFGIILAPKGGAFGKMILPTKLGIATVMGNGKQPFAWIDQKDHARAIEFIINHSEIKGIVNLVAPERITNFEFTTIIAKCLNSWMMLKVPATLLKLIMGEAASLLTEGQCVIPEKLLEAGFIFQSESMEDFMLSYQISKNNNQ